MPSAIRQLTAARLTPVGRGAVATIRVTQFRGEIALANDGWPGANGWPGHPFAEAPEGNAQNGARSIRRQRSNPEASVSNNTNDSFAKVGPFEALNSLFRAANKIPLSQQLLQQIAFGQWGQIDPEELVICRLANDVLEIHCHGGEAAVERILKDLSQAGCTIADWREQVASTADILASECLDVLSRTTTWRTTKIALEQSSGLLRAAYSQLTTCKTDEQFHQSIDSLLKWADFGLHLTKPWDVVLTGPPNVGKSSLINALLGYQRAIVFDEPGTTRDVVTGETAFEGWPVMLADTAGIRANVEGLEAAGIALAKDRVRTADLKLILIDLSQPTMQVDENLLREPANSILVAHKSDLSDHWSDRRNHHAVRVSSVTGEGLQELQQRLIERLVPVVPEPGTPVPITIRQIELLQRLQASNRSDERQQTLNQLLGNGCRQPASPQTS